MMRQVAESYKIHDISGMLREKAKSYRNYQNMFLVA